MSSTSHSLAPPSETVRHVLLVLCNRAHQSTWLIFSGKSGNSSLCQGYQSSPFVSLTPSDVEMSISRDTKGFDALYFNRVKVLLAMFFHY